jgi:hypothetical protein
MPHSRLRPTRRAIPVSRTDSAVALPEETYGPSQQTALAPRASPNVVVLQSRALWLSQVAGMLHHQGE